MRFSVDMTQDEFGTPRYFVASAGGAWVSEAFDTYDLAHQHARWMERKGDGKTVDRLLSTVPVGTEFKLGFDAGRAYAGTYRKNNAGMWDQVAAPERPLVINMDAEHLGFCVGEPIIRAALWAAIEQARSLAIDDPDFQAAWDKTERSL